MPLFKSKSRSKSTGRSPSRSELDINGSLEELVIDKTEVETTEPTEQKTESTEQNNWETLKCLADFTTQLDEKRLTDKNLTKPRKSI